MSFEMKYDVEGKPLPEQKPPVVEEVAPQEPEQVIEQDLSQEPSDFADEVSDLPEEQEQAPVSNKSAVKESWKVMRDRIEKAEKRAAELERAMQQAKPTREESVEEDIDLSLDQDALVEGRHLSKVDLKIKRLENQLRQYQQQNTLSATEIRLKSEYPDFDSVVSSENIANLRAAYPELADTLNANQDMYSKAVSAYTMIKRLGLMPEPEINVREKEIIKKNLAKPRALSSVNPQQGDSPLSRANAFANGLTDSLKEQLWKEMNEARKGY